MKNASLGDSLMRIKIQSGEKKEREKERRDDGENFEEGEKERGKRERDDGEKYEERERERECRLKERMRGNLRLSEMEIFVRDVTRERDLERRESEELTKCYQIMNYHFFTVKNDV